MFQKFTKKFNMEFKLSTERSHVAKTQPGRSPEGEVRCKPVHQTPEQIPRQPRQDCWCMRQNFKGLEEEKQNVLFCGNPGTGKSTLLNGLMNLPAFKSGITVGEGLTYDFDRHMADDGVCYMDTPGLSDSKMRQIAANAIAKAFKNKGWYRLVFVLTLQSGRVMPDDLTTIRLVLDAVPDIQEYGILFNKLSERVETAVRENLGKLLESLFADPNLKRTNKFFLSKFDSTLGDEDNKFSPAPSTLQEWINSIEPVYVRHVDKIDASTFEDKRQETDEAIAQVTCLQETVQVEQHKFEAAKQKAAADKQILQQQMAAVKDGQRKKELQQQEALRQAELRRQEEKVKAAVEAKRADAQRREEERQRKTAEQTAGKERRDQMLREACGCPNMLNGRRVKTCKDIYQYDDPHKQTKIPKGICGAVLGPTQEGERICINVKWDNGRTMYPHHSKDCLQLV